MVGSAAPESHRRNVAPIGRAVQPRFSVRTFREASYRTSSNSAYRLQPRHTTQHGISRHTSRRSRRRLRRQGRIYSSWRCVASHSSSAALQANTVQDAVEQELLSDRQIKSLVCAANVTLTDGANDETRNGQIRSRCRKRDVLRIDKHQDPVLQCTRLPREQGTYPWTNNAKERDR